MSHPMAMSSETIPCPFCGASLEPTVDDVCSTCRRSSIVCGGYRLERLLGRGATGAVYAARREPDGLRFAVKVRSLADRGSWRAHARFEASSGLLAGLTHPGLPRVHAFVPMASSGRAFVVLDLIEGTTLRALALAKVRIAEPRVLESLLRGLLDPLAYLHTCDPPLVHRDVSPYNVILSSAHERPVLIDCDALGPVDVDDEASLVGTLGFVAPEQLVGRATPASDVYAAAATVLFAMTGIDHDSPDFASLHTLPARLRETLTRMLASDPRQRPADAAAALRMLDEPPRARFHLRPSQLGACLAFVGVVGGLAWHHATFAAKPIGIDPSSPVACRIETDPPGAVVYAVGPSTTWSEEHPLSNAVGRTPFVVARDSAARRSLVLHAEGYRPYVVELDVPHAGESPCRFTARLVPR